MQKTVPVLVLLLFCAPASAAEKPKLTTEEGRRAAHRVVGHLVETKVIDGYRVYPCRRISRPAVRCYLKAWDLFDWGDGEIGRYTSYRHLTVRRLRNGKACVFPTRHLPDCSKQD